MSRHLPSRPSLAQLGKLVRELRKAQKAGDPGAAQRIRAYHPRYREWSDAALSGLELPQRSAQLVVAREHGFESWQELRRHVERREATGAGRVYQEPARRREDDERFARLVPACRRGDLAVVRRIVSEAPHLVHRTEWYRTPLHFAVLGGHRDVVAFLLEQGAHPAHPEAVGVWDTCLEIARNRGHDEIAALLHGAAQERRRDLPEGVAFPASASLEAWRAFLSEGPDRVDARGPEGNAPLHEAVRLRDRALVDLVLDHGAPVDAVRDDGFRPIHLAFYRNSYWSTWSPDPALARHLLDRGARYTITTAAALGDIERVRELLARDPALVNDPDTCQKRPLSSAVEGGHREIVDLLLARGADPNLPEMLCLGDGFALCAAVWRGDHETARVLLEHGANPDAGMDSAGTAYAVTADPRMHELLLSFGARVNITSHVCREEVETVERLLDGDPSLADGVLHVQDGGPEHEENYLRMFRAAFRHGANPAAFPGYAFHRALRLMPRVADFLMDQGVSPDLVIHDVAAAGELEIMERLLARGASVEAREPQYEATPLAFAARAGRREMVRLLLSHGARPRYPGDADYSTPAFWARKNHPDLLPLLRLGSDSKPNSSR